LKCPPRLSAQHKRKIQHDGRTLGALAASVNLNYAQLWVLMRDQIGIGPVVRQKIVKLGALLGVPEADCFREVGRG
jgi:hypothetical protein